MHLIGRSLGNPRIVWDNHPQDMIRPEVIDDCTLGRVRILLDMRDQSATT